MWKLIRPYLRGIYRILSGIRGFLYDISRFIRFGGWRGNMNEFDQRNYNAVMVYHGLEKSLSYQKRNSDSGWRNAFQIVELLKTAKASGNIGYHDRAAKAVLERFINLSENEGSPKTAMIRNELSKIDFDTNEVHGAIDCMKEDFEKGILPNPEQFFFSRHSLREFKNEIVSDVVIERAVKLAMKTPSVCNRQAWGIYHASDQELKDIVLTYQAGNKPFGSSIPNLMVIATDLKAFFSGSEHYQHWIDGGLLSMSLMYAFHSLGVATCALNWSQTPVNDKALRKYLNIKPHNTIIMILAIGYPNVTNKVCVSARRPIEEVFELEKR